MPITMICPHLSCGQTVVAPDSARGKVLRCAHCKRTFMVPDRGPPQPSPVSEDSTGEPPAKR